MRELLFKLADIASGLDEAEQYDLSNSVDNVIERLAGTVVPFKKLNAPVAKLQDIKMQLSGLFNNPNSTYVLKELLPYIFSQYKENQSWWSALIMKVNKFLEKLNNFSDKNFMSIYDVNPEFIDKMVQDLISAQNMEDMRSTFTNMKHIVDDAVSMIKNTDNPENQKAIDALDTFAVELQNFIDTEMV